MFSEGRVLTHQVNETTVLILNPVRQLDTLALPVATVPLGQVGGELRAPLALLEADVKSALGEVVSVPDEPA